jgi:hypothetical protein
MKVIWRQLLFYSMNAPVMVELEEGEIDPLEVILHLISIWIGPYKNNSLYLLMFIS